MSRQYCNTCLTDMQRQPFVSEYIRHRVAIRIPFTNWVLGLYEDKPDYFCPECVAEESRQKGQGIYDSGWNDAMDRVNGYD